MIRSVRILILIAFAIILSGYYLPQARSEADTASPKKQNAPEVKPGVKNVKRVPVADGRVYSVEGLDALVKQFGDDARWSPFRINLAPARWIWFESRRTLPNTFVLFRREIDLDSVPRRAWGWISADSRYRLTVNGKRVQWGPAPCDPRHYDADPFDITRFLRPGKNVIGVEVLFYGIGEGTWVAGKPGMIFHLRMDMGDGKIGRIVSDDSWRLMIDRAHRPGQYKRWFLRCLQEEFDSRLHPYGWDQPGFEEDERWLPAVNLICAAHKPPSCSHYASNDTMDRAREAVCTLRARQIPMLREYDVPVMKLSESGNVKWKRDPLDWFDMRIANSFDIDREVVALPAGEKSWRLPATPGTRTGAYATFEFKDHVVGWPHFTIDASEGTVVELMTQEAHDPRGPAWLDSHFFAWSRFVCREGINHFEAFDFESLRWLQLHVRGSDRPVTISNVGVRRRQFKWPNQPLVRCSEPKLQRLFDAGINTLHNSAQETCVDGMGRERQQYSGDGGHQLIATRCAFGENRLSRRFLRTFSEGLAKEGYFFDSWPAFDRMARIQQKELDGAFWGPLLDHGMGFNFDCYNYYFETGDLDSLREPYPRLLRFAQYIESLREDSGLLPVANLGIPTVWIDHEAYRDQRHKQCAFNLYAAAMYKHALAPICHAFGDNQKAQHWDKLGDSILAATISRFWDQKRKMFVCNLPWGGAGENMRLCDRSLAMSILFDQCPANNTQAALKALVECPKEMGISYPCNANWRYWALAKLGRADVVIKDFRKRWATMDSVVLNKTLQEGWGAATDSTSQWSHCALAPIFVLYQDIAGIRPTKAGFETCQVRPQLGDLQDLDIKYYTVRGPIRFTVESQDGGHRLSLKMPPGCEGELLLPAGSKTDLTPLTPDHPQNLKRFRLPPGKVSTCFIPSTSKKAE